MNAILDWFDSSPFANVLGIILIVLGVIVILKLAKNITKPIFVVLIIVAAVLIFFNVIDLALVAANGQKLVSCICNKVVSDSDLAGKAGDIVAGLQ